MILQQLRVYSSNSVPSSAPEPLRKIFHYRAVTQRLIHNYETVAMLLVDYSNGCSIVRLRVYLLSSGGVSVGSSDVKSVSKLDTSVASPTSGLKGGSI